MFVIKLNNNNYKKNYILSKTIDSLLSFLSSKKNDNLRVIKDSSSVEIISGNLESNNVEDEIYVELMVKKVIKIPESNLTDKQELDKFIKEIKNFYEQASAVDATRYLPINFRE